jgi:peptide/nickel transport system substrate-binding protein
VKNISPINGDASGMTRRMMLRGTALTGLAIGAGSLLSGCFSSDTPSKTAGGPPRRGGTLRVGMVGAGKTESMNPSGTVSALINMALCGAVYDSLVQITPDLKLDPSLATKWSSDDSAKTWTIDLRNDVKWHNGDPFTAEDVIYTLKWSNEPESNLGDYTSGINIEGLRAQSPSVLVVPLNEPDMFFMHKLSALFVIKNGTTKFDQPVGTGPFVFESLTPGQQGTFGRNPNYWIPEKPYVDKLVIQSITDDTARLNALQGGQIDVMGQVPLSQAKTIDSQGLKLLSGPSTAGHAFYMAVDQAPFSDPRVRQAFRLLADREQLVNVALNGFGTVGNDLYGKGLQFYDDSLPQRTLDVDKAKALLAEAGFASGLTVELQTSNVVPGMVEAATLFQQQAKAGGVEINIVNVDASAYFDPSQKFLKMPFAQTYWAGTTEIVSFFQLALLPGAISNETHWDNAKTTALIEQASQSISPQEAGPLWNQVQKEQYDEGGYIWWGIPDFVDATAGNVAGITPSKNLPLGLPWGLADAYFVS